MASSKAATTATPVDEGDEGEGPGEGEGIARGRTEGDWPPAGAVPRGWRARAGL